MSGLTMGTTMNKQVFVYDRETGKLVPKPNPPSNLIELLPAPDVNHFNIDKIKEKFVEAMYRRR